MEDSKGAGRRSLSSIFYPLSSLRLVCIAALLPALTGCNSLLGSPSKSNNQIRRERQKLQQQLDAVKEQRAADQRLIAALRSKIPTVPVLPPERLDRLYTTHGLKFGRLTGGADLDRKQAGDEGIKVYVVPTDQQGTPLKAAGSFVVEAFDLSDSEHPLVGRWEFPLAEAQKAWSNYLLDYTYVLTARWQDRMPRGSELTVKVTFTDELTQLEFTDQTRFKIELPTAAAATGTPPATQP